MPLLKIPKDQECPYHSKCGLYHQCYKTEEDEEDYYCPTYIAFLNQGVAVSRDSKPNKKQGEGR